MTPDTSRGAVRALVDLSPAEMAAIGVGAIAFIKPVMIGGTAAYAIFAADGQQLALAANRASAIATVRQNDMEPVGVN